MVKCLVFKVAHRISIITQHFCIFNGFNFICIVVWSKNKQVFFICVETQNSIIPYNSNNNDMVHIIYVKQIFQFN